MKIIQKGESLEFPINNLGNFQNHGISSLVWDIAIYIFWVAILKLATWLVKNKENRKHFGKFAILAFFVFAIFAPNITYGAYEVKHLIRGADTIAEPPDIWSYLVFGGISLLGVVITIWGIHEIIENFVRGSLHKLFWRVVMALIFSFGAVIGLFDYSSIDGVLNPAIFLTIARDLIDHPSYILLGLISSAAFFLASQIYDWYLNSRRKKRP